MGLRKGSYIQTKAQVLTEEDAKKYSGPMGFIIIDLGKPGGQDDNFIVVNTEVYDEDDTYIICKTLEIDEAILVCSALNDREIRSWGD